MSSKQVIDPRRQPDIFTGTAMTNRTKGRLNKRAGEEAQELVESFMRQVGYRCVERIETGFSVIRRGKQIVGAFPKRSVSGDVKAIGHKGRAVHVEIKHRPTGNLTWASFAPHQIEALDGVTGAEGEAFVAWVVSIYPPRLFWLQWPIPGFRKGKGLTREMAAAHRGDHFGFVNGNPK